MKAGIEKRKFWIVAGLILFLVEMALLVWPVGWLEETQVHYLSGEGSWNLSKEEGSFSCCQEFQPQYGKLKSIGIVAASDAELEGGNAVVVVSDAENRILFETVIPYEELNLDQYTDIETNLSLPSGGKNCYLSVYLEADERGTVPVLKACSTEYFMKENMALSHEDQLQETQLLTKYCYDGVVTKGKILRAAAICLITAFGIAIGFPGKPRFRLAVGIALLLSGPYLLGRRLEMLTLYGGYLLPFSMKWNMGIMYLPELILLLCTWSIPVTICASNLLLTILYTANYFVFSFRGTPLRLNDLSATETAFRVVGHYSLRPNGHMAMAWCILTVFLVYGAQTGNLRKSKRDRKRLVTHLVTLSLGIALALISGWQLLGTDMLVKAGFLNTHGIDQHMNYQFNGYLVASFMDIKDSKVKKPQGYTAEKAEEILAGGREGMESIEESSGPHIILIMNESFADLRVLGNLQLSEENMPFIKSLQENAIHGYVNASVLGGGTANSEFEVFTGCSMGFLPAAYYAYQQCMSGDRPSLISHMKNLGYTAYSIHPEAAVNWNRNRVYSYFGFDKSFWIEDFPDAEKLHFGVSDLETYRKVEEIFEEREAGERLFLFDLTVQNHGGYTESDVEQQVKALNVDSEEADTFLSLVRESDKAFQQLIRYFEKMEEPVLICMYGDHQPKPEDGFYQEVYDQTEGLTEADHRRNLYKTPFVIWANYDIPEREEMDIGMSYLGTVLPDVAELPKTAYFSFLGQYMEEYPIVTINGYQDKNGKVYDWSGEGSELPEYRIVQYNYLFDRNMVEWGF